MPCIAAGDRWRNDDIHQATAQCNRAGGKPRAWRCHRSYRVVVSGVCQSRSAAAGIPLLRCLDCRCSLLALIRRHCHGRRRQIRVRITPMVARLIVVLAKRAALRTRIVAIVREPKSCSRFQYDDLAPRAVHAMMQTCVAQCSTESRDDEFTVHSEPSMNSCVMRFRLFQVDVRSRR